MEWKDLLSKVCRWINPCYITFTGGEPFSKEGFFDVLEHANKLNAYSVICTNGMALDERNCDRLIKTGVDFLIFSLNSIDPRVHDRYKGVEGLHQKIVSAIRYIKKKSNLCIGITFVVAADNYMIMGDFADWVYGLGVDCINYLTIRDSFGPNFSPTPSIYASTSNPLWKIDDLGKLDEQVELLIRKKKRGLPIITSAQELRTLKIYFRDPQVIPRRRYCDLGFRNMIVSSTGDVKLCYMSPTMGNIRKNHMRDIWFSKETHVQRMGMFTCKIPCMPACLRKLSFSEKAANFFIQLNPRMFPPE
jgi:MoaA/NifB/PqqE/SkfB family radical SAM enzyme